MKNQSNIENKILSDLEGTSQSLGKSILESEQNDIPFFIALLAVVVGIYSAVKADYFKYLEDVKS